MKDLIRRLNPACLLAVLTIVLALALYGSPVGAGINDVIQNIETGGVSENAGAQNATADAEAGAEAAKQKAEKFELAVIADLHIDKKTYDEKKEVIAKINSMHQIDAVAILGDLSEKVASPEEFEISKKFVDQIRHKKYPITGNHDYIYEDELLDNGKKDRGEPGDRKKKLERFVKAYGIPGPHYAVKANGYLLIFLCADALSGKRLVTLADKTLDWLDKTLDKNREMPTMIFCHAPLEGTLEKIGDLGASSFAQPAGKIEKILRAHDQVFLWGSGHTHTAPSSENFMSAKNFWHKQIHAIHTPTLNNKNGYFNMITLEKDFVTVRTYNCEKNEWMKRYDRKYKHKFSNKSVTEEPDKKDDEKDKDKKEDGKKDKEDLKGIVVPGLDGAKVRKAPWGEVMGTLFSGKFVDIRGEEGDWYVIDYQGKKGYILKQALLTNKGDDDKLKKVEGKGTVDVNPSFGLNVRDGAWGDKIGKLGDGDKIDIIGQEGDWYKINFKGKTGFVYKQYVKASLEKGAAAPAADKPKSDGREESAEKPKESSANTAGGDDKTAKDGIKGTKGFEANGRLNVPERAQRAHENGSLGSSFCGPTSLAMALEFFGIDKPTKSVAKETKTISSGGAWQGTCCENIAAAAKQNLPGSYMKSNMSIDDLKNITAAGKPVVVNVDTQGYWSKGHYMVVTGVSNGKVYVNDPWKGGERSYSFAAFKAQWATRSNRGVILQR